jgi:hypothetical protein
VGTILAVYGEILMAADTLAGGRRRDRDDIRRRHHSPLTGPASTPGRSTCTSHDSGDNGCMVLEGSTRGGGKQRMKIKVKKVEPIRATQLKPDS